MVAEFRRQDARQSEILIEVRRLADALLAHTHDTNTGLVDFRLPPTGTTG